MVFNLDILNVDKDISNLISKKDSFTLVETGYTSRIKQVINGKNINCLYTERRKDIDPLTLKRYGNFVLKYINKVRALANKFELKRDVVVYNDLGWCSYFANLPKDMDIYCIDVKSAYFYSAISLGLFTPDYVDEYNSCFEKEVGFESLYKPSRLVVLGSLATKRRTRVYKKGTCIDDTGYLIYNEKMRDVYVEICRGVDDLMLELNTIPGTVGYYWDCVFAISELSAKKVEDEIIKKGFEFKTEKRKATTYYYPNGGGCLVTNPNTDKEKKYQFNYRKVLAL